MRVLPRRGLLAGLGTLPSVVRASVARAASEPIVIVCPSVANATSLVVLNAKAGGHFATHGLDAAVEASGTGVGAMQQLAAGRCHFLRAGAIELIKAVARQQVPLLAIANDEHTVTYLMLSSTERPIREAAMLKGKRVGVLAAGSTMDNYLDLMLHHAGLPQDAVERQVVGANPGSFELIRLGRLDGVILPHEGAWPLLHPAPGAPATDVVVLPISRSVLLPGRCYLTSRDIADRRPELALAFMRAIAASVLEFIVGPIGPLVIRCATAFDMPGLGPMAQSVAIVQWDIQTWLADGRAALLRNLDPVWRAGVEAMAQAGLARVPPGTKLYTNRFVAQALPA
jgi:NitT/TauT family transport system substrate-binding protein